MAAAEDRPGNAAGFPRYRRLRGGGHYYRIDGPDRFVEVQVVGTRRLVHTVQARAYPELLRIQEMIDGAEGRYEEITANDWSAVCPPE